MPSYDEEVRPSYEITVEDQILIAQGPLGLAGQQPRLNLGKEDLLRIHHENILLLQKSPKSGRAHQIVLPSAYRPSTARLDSLQKILLQDLQLETHYRGRFVTGKTITPPFVSTEIVTIIEEEGGGVAKIVLCYHDESWPESAPPEGSTIIIKEPYCKRSSIDGDYVIRVDHPSDVAILRGDDPTIPLILEFVTGKASITPIEWRDAGDKAYLGKRYSAAIESYTQAIDGIADTDSSILRDLNRKRAYTNLTIKQFRSAERDALEACSDDYPDQKAYICIARASYELGKYEESSLYYQKASTLIPGNPRVKEDYQRALTRTMEQKSGVFDFQSMVTFVEKGQIHLDHADFTSNTAIRPSPHHGRGLFATKFIHAGDIVLCEKALCLPNLYGEGHENPLMMFNFNTSTRTDQSAQAALFLQLIGRVFNDPETAKRVFDLDSGDYMRSGQEGDIVDGTPIIDSFLVESIRRKNCFSSPRLSRNLLKTHVTNEDGALSTGLWTRAAYINHSCVPNCARSFIGDFMILRAICDIPAETELTHQYIDPSYSSRRELFRTTWEFECGCPLCRAEAKSPANMHQKRGEVVDKIKAEVMKWPSVSKAPRSAVRNIERLTGELEELYETDVYLDNPRLLLLHPTIWLVEAHRQLKNPSKTIKFAFEVLRNFGLFNVVRGRKLQIDYSKGITNRESLVALLYAAEAHQALGKIELAKECEREAKLMFVILSGSSVCVGEMWNIVFGSGS